jgi:redox-sensitive bicupin YhaK (pirin superfamily)
MTIKIGDANHHFLNRSKVEHYNSRSVSRIINSTKTTEGGGFIVSRPFPTNTLLDFDPFLLLDEMGPKNWKPGEAKDCKGRTDDHLQR